MLNSSTSSICQLILCIFVLKKIENVSAWNIHNNCCHAIQTYMNSLQIAKQYPNATISVPDATGQRILTIYGSDEGDCLFDVVSQPDEFGCLFNVKGHVIGCFPATNILVKHEQTKMESESCECAELDDPYIERREAITDADYKDASECCNTQQDLQSTILNLPLDLVGARTSIDVLTWWRESSLGHDYDHYYAANNLLNAGRALENAEYLATLDVAVPNADQPDIVIPDAVKDVAKDAARLDATKDATQHDATKDATQPDANTNPWYRRWF